LRRTSVGVAVRVFSFPKHNQKIDSWWWEMVTAERVEQLKYQTRHIEVSSSGDPDLGVLQLLPGTWSNVPDLIGHGWNAIALPFAFPGSGIDYRLLVNQYNEVLKFTLVDKGVKNRGIRRGVPSLNTDQVVVALDNEQRIEQIAAADSPDSGGLAGPPNTVIHHEPGLWLFLTNEAEPHCNISRLGTIPHGDSLLALGAGSRSPGPPVVPEVNGLPIGVVKGPPIDLNTVLANPYLAPYAHFHQNPFKGVVAHPAFAGFDPTQPHKLLVGAVPGTVKRTTKLEVSTRVETGGIVNVPFIVRQANAAEMISTFWICELEETDAYGNPRLIMQYLQIVLLDFFGRVDGMPGPIRWPHVSINTMEKTAEPDAQKAITPPADVEKKL
jgi:hypothetical protein